MKCVFCQEEIHFYEERADMNLDAHRECALREVIGGIGHLIDHAHFCSGVGPDAGLDRRTSSLMVDIWVHRNGIEAATRVGHEVCDRCGETVSAFTTSYFNTDTLCMECDELETQHPDYPAAKEAELAAVLNGDWNFPGVGLPDGYEEWAKGE